MTEPGVDVECWIQATVQEVCFMCLCIKHPDIAFECVVLVGLETDVQKM